MTRKREGSVSRYVCVSLSLPFPPFSLTFKRAAVDFKFQANLHLGVFAVRVDSQALCNDVGHEDAIFCRYGVVVPFQDL